MTKTEIMSEVFHRHIKAHELNEAIRVLVELGCVTREFEATSGRRKEYIYYVYITNRFNLSRTYMRLLDLARLAVDAKHRTNGHHNGLPCELSEKSEEIPSRGVNAGDALETPACELSEKIELSPPVTPPPSLRAGRRARVLSLVWGDAASH
jgi:hypothetical protein